MKKTTEKLNIHFMLSFNMLLNIVENCPGNLWISDKENESIWKRVLHVLESIDFWFDDFSVYHFDRMFGFFSAEMDRCNASVLTKSDIFKYLDLINIKIQNFFDMVNDEILTEASTKHPSVTYLDIILSQIRHIQINIGYCNEKYNSKGIKSPEWLGHNEESVKNR
ncbi:MAG TPA: hypothetical protein VHP36_10090 [Chitinispirillaceae bacterium]|nr:hypothetical protein [Chitinispirillaceae bacterium]